MLAGLVTVTVPRAQRLLLVQNSRRLTRRLLNDSDKGVSRVNGNVLP